MTTKTTHLMSFIRSLQANSEKDVREKKRAELEKDYNDVNRTLEKCLFDKKKDVQSILNVYTSVSKVIDTNKNSISRMKKDLIECKTLLRCNSEDLRRLWIELTEQREILEYLDLIDQVRFTPDVVLNLIRSKRWLEATELLNMANKISREKLQDVAALQNISTDLAMKNAQLVEAMSDEIKRFIFKQMLTNSIKNIKAKKEVTHENIKIDWLSVSVDKPIIETEKLKDIRSFMNKDIRNANLEALPGSMENENWERSLVDVLYCLQSLEKLQEKFDTYKYTQYNQEKEIEEKDHIEYTKGCGLIGELHNEISVKAMEELSTQLIHEGEPINISKSKNVTNFVRYLDLVFSALFSHACAFMIILRVFNNMKEKNILGASFDKELIQITPRHIWQSIQYELQYIIMTHTNIKDVKLNNSDQGVSVMSDLELSNSHKTGKKIDTAIDLDGNLILEMMSKKRTNIFGLSDSDNLNENASANLFSFTNMENLRRSQNQPIKNNEPMSLPRKIDTLSQVNPKAKGNYTDIEELHSYSTICEPNIRNICYVYLRIQKYIAMIEKETNNVSLNLAKRSNVRSDQAITRTCCLRKFLSIVVERNLIPSSSNQILVSLKQKLAVQLDSEMLQCVISKKLQRELGLPRPILQIVIHTQNYLAELKKMAYLIPEYLTQCLEISKKILDEFNNAISKKIQDFTKIDCDTSSPSFDWSFDDDISRFWKKFPNWTRMAEADKRYKATNKILNKTASNDIKLDSKGISFELKDQFFDNIDDNFEDEEFESPRKGAAFRHSMLAALGLHSTHDLGVTHTESSDINYEDSSDPIRRLFGNTMVNITRDLYQTSSGSGNKDNEAFMRMNLVLHESEATRLATEESNRLNDLIEDELLNSNRLDLETIKSEESLQKLGILHESLCWLYEEVCDFEAWQKKEVDKFNGLERESGNITPTKKRSETAFSPLSQKSSPDDLGQNIGFRLLTLDKLSTTCLLTIYLEIRIMAYNTFGRIDSDNLYNCAPDKIVIEPNVNDFLKKLSNIKEVLGQSMSKHKFRFIFDSLGDFISQLFLKLIEKIKKMNSNGNKKICSLLYRLQQEISSITENPETDLIRVKQFYELFNLKPEAVVNRVMEQGSAFPVKSYQDLFLLYQRSHPTYNNNKAKEAVQKIADIISSQATY